MKKIFTVRRIGFGVVFLSMLLSCFGCMRKSHKVNADTAEVYGMWQEYVEVVGGVYPTNYTRENGVSRITIPATLKLTKPFEGDANAVAANLELVPLSRIGAQINGAYMPLTSVDKFKDFITGSPGSTTSLTFTMTLNDRKKAKSTFIKFRGFDIAQTSGTRGKRVIAMAQLSAPGVSADEIRSMRAILTGGFLRNKNAERFSLVDTGYIDQIMEQHQFQTSDWADSNRVAEIGKALNADILALGSVSPYRNGAESGYNVSFQLLNINTMEIVGAFHSSTPADAMRVNLEAWTSNMDMYF
ncbi:MAG: hypothetical protein LBQ55_03055 [Treponema sp.]|jgi:hypothetical protein|nr:hypothetical protein [Treponema sp.]